MSNRLDASLIQGTAVQPFGSKPHELPIVPTVFGFDRDPEALAFANGLPLRKRRAIRIANFLAMVVVTAFVVVALVRSP